MIFELTQDFHDAVAVMPRGHPKHRMLELLEEAIRRDIHFIARHPTNPFLRIRRKTMRQILLRRASRCRKMPLVKRGLVWPVLLLTVLLARNAPQATAGTTKIWDANGQVVFVNSDAVAGAPNIAISRDGAPVTVGDQIVVSYRAGTMGLDFRQVLALGTNGFMRLRHLDGAESPTNEDKFGTSIKLPPGLILDNGGTEGFYLRSKITQIDLVTVDSASQILRLKMTGSPADGQGILAPATTQWCLTLLPPTNKVTVVLLDVETTVTQPLALSGARMLSAEAFQAAMFSSSNTDASTTYPLGTHDADQLRITSAAGQTLSETNLSSPTLRNQLLIPSGRPFDGTIQLNQIVASPLNGDPPCISIRILPSPDLPEYRAQGYVFSTTDSNDDNLGVWASRTFTDPAISTGRRFAWTLRIVASDEPGADLPSGVVEWSHY
jgi:hypothetical protein